MKKFAIQAFGIGLGILLGTPLKSFSQCGTVPPANPDELVANGDFEQNFSISSGPMDECTISSGAGTCSSQLALNWCAYSQFHRNTLYKNDPDYIVRNPKNGGLAIPVRAVNGKGSHNGSGDVETHDVKTNPDNNAYVHLITASEAEGGPISEGISTELIKAVVPGEFYKVKAWVYADNHNERIPIHFYFHNNYSVSDPQVQLSPVYSAEIRNTTNPFYNWNDFYEWEEVELVFQIPLKASPDLTHMTIEAGRDGDYFIDDVSLVVTCANQVNAGTDKIQCFNSGITTLTASGANTYSWTGSDGSSYVGQTIYVAPNSTTTYTVTGIDAGGCQSTDKVVVWVKPQPTISVSTTSITVCAGTPVTITASGANTYVWRYNTTTLGNSNTLTFTPTASGNYWVKGFSIDGCPSLETRIVIILSPAPTPVFASISSGYSASICQGETTQLTVSGGTSPYPVTYTWYQSGSAQPIGTGTILNVTPSSTSSYYVVASVTYNNVTCTKISSPLTVTVNLSTAPGYIGFYQSRINGGTAFDYGLVEAVSGINHVCYQGSKTETVADMNVAGTWSVVTPTNGLTATASGIGFNGFKITLNGPSSNGTVRFTFSTSSSCGASKDFYFDALAQYCTNPIIKGSSDPNLFEVFPNPGNTIVTVRKKDLGDVNKSDPALPISKVVIYNLQGSKVKTLNLNNAEEANLSVEEINAGTYIMEITSGQKVERQRINVSH